MSYQEQKQVFFRYRDYIKQVVRGLKVRLDQEEGFGFELSVKKRMDAILKNATKVTTLIVSMRDAEYLLAEVEDTLFTVNIVKTELKEVVERSKSDQELKRYGSVALHEIKVCYGIVCDYSDMVKQKYDMVAQLIETLRSMSTNMRWVAEKEGSDGNVNIYAGYS